MKILLYITFALVLTEICCQQNPRSETYSSTGADSIVIEGAIKNLPDGWIWLTPADRWKIHLDSAQIKDGYFRMQIARDSLADPVKVSLRYADNTKPGGIATLKFRNDRLGKKAGESLPPLETFYFEDHAIKIEGELDAVAAPRILAGKETDIMFRNQVFDFGWIDFPKDATRKQRIEFLKNIIRIEPHSYYLLENLFRFKEQYSKEEFLGMLTLFEKNVLQSRLGDTIKLYLSRRPGAGQSYALVPLAGPDGKIEQFPDNLRPVNMVVFWASWCPPCRREIPALKGLYWKYKDAGLQMLSISIDQDIKKWNEALKEEKMPWKQLRVGNDQIETIMQQYNFHDIPLTIFIDSAGREIKRFSGYDPESRINFMFLEENLPAKN